MATVAVVIPILASFRLIVSSIFGDGSMDSFSSIILLCHFPPAMITSLALFYIANKIGSGVNRKLCLRISYIILAMLPFGFIFGLYSLNLLKRKETILCFQNDRQ